MYKTDSVGYSVDLSVFYSAQSRVISSALKDQGNVSPGELTALLALYEVKRPVSAESLANFLFYDIRTVRNILLKLEDLELVSKTSDITDGRFFLARLTNAGTSASIQLACNVYNTVKEAFWKALPEDDFQKSMKINMRKCLNNLRGFPVDPFGEYPETDLPLEVDHLIYWRVAQERWGAITKQVAGLSHLDSTILQYICGHEGSCSKDVGHDLIVPKSAVSLGIHRLIDAGLVIDRADAYDGRSRSLFPTKKGKTICRKLFSALDDTTREFHMGVDKTDLDIIRAWYMRMIANMRTASD